MMNDGLPASKLDLAALREKLKASQGKKFWRSLEEAAETPEFQEMLQREFPSGASTFADPVGRREFLKVMAASLALAGIGTACTKQPVHPIVPYVTQPELITLGVPLTFASAMPHNGFGLGILAKSYEGHPVKIEGNPNHPASLGATNVFMQAALLDLYDPDRARAITVNGDIAASSRFATVVEEAMQAQKAKGGAGLRILSETVTSPTLVDQMESLLRTFPKARWDCYQPISRDAVYQGAQMAFGEVVEPRYVVEKAEVILALDSDFLFTEPGSLYYARKFADGRRVSAGSLKMNRLYAAESSPSITGSMADHRLAVRPSVVPLIAWEVARQLGVSLGASAPPAPKEFVPWIKAVVADLQKHRGSSLVTIGEQQPPVVHALGHAINEALGNFGKIVLFTEPVVPRWRNQLDAVRKLTQEMQSGQVEMLLILGGNPAFTAPADVEFGKALAKVRLSIHLSSYQNETSQLCGWHVPETHFLEAWSDVRAFDGTVSIVQPLIAPLYGGVSVHDLIGSLTNLPGPNSYQIVRAYWQKRGLGADFETFWKESVRNGLIANTRLPSRQLKVNVQGIGPAPQPPPSDGNLEVCFRPDPSIWDGRYANNGWLQELAKPITKLTWDNAALVSPALAQEYHLSNGDFVELQSGGRSLRIPVWITPGQAEHCVTLQLGNGRREVGQVGKGVGFDVYPLRTSQAFWSGNVVLAKVQGTHAFAATQLFHNVQNEERQVLRTATLPELQRNPDFVQPTVKNPPKDETLYYPEEYDYAGYRWGMSIDLTTCIGCNACVLGCQSENNIPVVGKDQVRRGRVMEWIRIDTYYEGDADNPQMHHEPVPCMHCENAPCELVCPVEATLHDHEGLNLQVYNRCVGTRFCSNNCPYKVRRFNFFQFADYHTAAYQPMRNPQVTVRWRGVMEKCTYCLQRITVTRINAQKENRRIRDGELQTACQQACPTEAIIFGDLSDPNSKVSKLQKNPLNFSMLGQLNTRPRTMYLTKVTNPNPEMR